MSVLMKGVAPNYDTTENYHPTMQLFSSLWSIFF